MDKKIFFLGAGNMAESIIAALLREEVFEPQNVFINDISAECMSYMAGEYHVTALSDPVTALKNADIFLLAVRPQDIADLGWLMDAMLER
ncbi:MAG: NAD(P)-binding domain-containing protein, partial [Firmicutes bacterium]|nr:NAD(P)-binding domain-containing protein [Bacillota bacterium]